MTETPRTLNRLAGASDRRIPKTKVTLTSLKGATPNKTWYGNEAQLAAARESETFEQNEIIDELYRDISEELTDDGTLFRELKGDKNALTELVKKDVECQATILVNDMDVDDVTNYLTQSYLRKMKVNDIEEAPALGTTKTINKTREHNMKFFKDILTDFENIAAHNYKLFILMPTSSPAPFSSYLDFYSLYICDLIVKSKSLSPKEKKELMSMTPIVEIYSVAETPTDAKGIIDRFYERVVGHDNDYSERKVLAKKVFTTFPYYATYDSKYYRAFEAAMK